MQMKYNRNFFFYFMFCANMNGYNSRIQYIYKFVSFQHDGSRSYRIKKHSFVAYDQMVKDLNRIIVNI